MKQWLAVHIYDVDGCRSVIQLFQMNESANRKRKHWGTHTPREREKSK